MTTVQRRTFLQRAREEAATPFTIGDLSPAESQKLAEKWAAQMKPVLLEAAREKRALRAEDLKAVDRLPDGRGVALDDVLDFLLSPAGAPLQKLLGELSKPDDTSALLPFFDDDDGPAPAPWKAPPKDRFEEHLRAAKRRDAFGTQPQVLLHGAINAFAEATGKNGRVDEAAVQKQGPWANALYTMIAQKIGSEGGGKLPNPVQGQKLAGLAHDVVVKVGRGVDVAPVRGRMKAFDAVVDALLGPAGPTAKKPLQGVKVVAIQHLLPTLSGVLDGLERAGVSRSDMRLIGKSYSTVDEMYAWLNAQGYDVHEGSIGGNAGSVEERLVEAARDTLEELFDGVDPKTSKERFLLADDGGKLLYALHKYFPQYAPLCAGFEQTARGIQVLEKMEAEGIPVQCPVVNMAKSALKNDSEIPLIGENVVFDSFKYLDELKLPKPQTATVLGCGPVGQQVAKALLARGVDVVVYDPSPKPIAPDIAALAKEHGRTIRFASREDALGAGDLVVGCTGRGALEIVDELHHLKDGAVLVNGASGNHELGTDDFGKRGRWFMEMHFEPKDLRVNGGALSCSFQGKRVALGSGDLGSASMHRVLRSKDTGKEALVLRSGHVVNLGRDLPPEFIQVTRSLVFASILQAAASTKAGVVDVDAGTQQLIAGETQKDLDRLGLSFARPDFSQLPSWDL